MEICDFSYHHGAYFHHEDGSELFCFQQSVFSGVFFVDGIYIVCYRIHCVENAGQSYIRGFSSICHIAVMMIVIYCQSENQRIAACVSLSNCLILQKLSCCIFCIFDAETWVWADPVYGKFSVTGADQDVFAHIDRAFFFSDAPYKEVIPWREVLFFVNAQVNLVVFYKIRYKSGRKSGVKQDSRCLWHEGSDQEFQAESATPVII